MRVTYLLDRPELGGGTKVVLQQARLLGGRGHAVTVAAEGERPAWADPRGYPGLKFLDLSQAPHALPPQDLVVATFWTTIARAERLGAGPVAHFCQGFEAASSERRSLCPWASRSCVICRYASSPRGQSSGP